MTWSIQITLSPHDSPAAKAIGAARGPAAFKVRWQPVFVLELENTTKAEGTTPTGSVTRSQLGADVSVFPWADKAGNRLELLLGGRLWSELGKAEALGPVDRLIPLGSVSLTGYFDSGRHVGVGLEVVTGSNPPEGLVDQRYLQLGLKVRY